MTKPKVNIAIGDYEVCAIPTGQFGLDGGAMFGTVPKVLWEKAIPPDEKNRIPMEARACLLKSKSRNILIDTGNGGDFVAKYGEKLGGKFAEMYNIDPSGPSLLNSLKQNGVHPDQITDVILTHLHFDHAGGATHAVDGKIVPTFKNATYYVQAANLETARKPNLRERASYYSVNFQPLIDAGVLKVLDGPCEILPGISVFISNGHTTGQQIVKVSSPSHRGGQANERAQAQDRQEDLAAATRAESNAENSSDGSAKNNSDRSAESGASLVYCGDLIPTSAHVKLAWVMGYDLRPLELIEEKEKLLSQASDQSWFLFFEHDPECDVSKVGRNGADFSVSEKFVLANRLAKN